MYAQSPEFRQILKTFTHTVNSAYWVILHAFLSSVDLFSKSFFVKSFRNTIKVSNSLDPDQARQNVGLIWVQTVCKLSADDKELITVENIHW